MLALRVFYGQNNGLMVMTFTLPIIYKITWCQAFHDSYNKVQRKQKPRLLLVLFEIKSVHCRLLLITEDRNVN